MTIKNNTSGSKSGSRPAPSAPPKRSKSDSTSTSSGGGSNKYFTPKHKKTNSVGSTPETAKSATPSPQNKRSSPKSSPRSSPRNSPRTTPSGSPRTSPKGSPRNSPRSSFRAFFVDTSNDETVARRLEQELKDAELASRLASVERASADFAVDSIPVGNIATLPSRQNSKQSSRQSSRGESFHDSPPLNPKNNVVWMEAPEDCRGKAIYYTLRIGIALLVTCISFIIFLVVFGKATNDSLDPATWLPGYPEMDPGLGRVGEHNKWKPGNNQNANLGLSLTVLNNLVSGSDWNEYLQTAISEWDNGTPDAVTLNIRSMAHDPDCRAVRRAMKVCNANYGPTDWRGVNQILLQDDYIITSLAKMNDYYLEGTNMAQKQYTMCHEIGHGLGLGHSDENFYNKDLGNCMDYTERPQNNMHPDTSNFQTLEELYGNVNGATNLRVERVVAVPGESRRMMNEEEEHMLEEEFETFAAYLSDPIDVSSEFANRDDESGSWRLLHRTETAEIHERRLGNGYSIRTSVLLA